MLVTVTILLGQGLHTVSLANRLKAEACWGKKTMYTPSGYRHDESLRSESRKYSAVKLCYFKFNIK